MKNIKKLLTGLPKFNFFIISTLLILGKLEEHFFPMTEDSAPITLMGALFILLFIGGFFVCGLVLGLLKTLKVYDTYKNIVIQIIILTLITEIMYVVFFFLIFLSNKYTNIIGGASTVTLEQISGYIVGCIIGKLIHHRKNKYNLKKN